MKEPGFPPPDKKVQQSDSELPELEGGVSIRVSTGKRQQPRNTGRKRRGKGKIRKTQTGPDVSPDMVQAEEPNEVSPIDMGGVAGIEEKIDSVRATFDMVYSATLQMRKRIETPSAELSGAWERYAEAVRELNAHEDAYDDASAAERLAVADTELDLLKAALSAAEVFLRLADTADKTAALEENQQITNTVDIESDTPAEKRRMLRSAVEEMRQLEKAREGLQGTDEARGLQEQYFEALKAHHKKRSILGVAAAEVVGEGALESKKLKQMRKQWIASRARLARAAHESVDARLAVTPSRAREELLARLREKYGNTERANLHARYERRFWRSAIILDAERAELEAREEGLAARDKGMLDRVYEGYKKLPPGVRILSTAALMFGASAAVAGTPFGWTALGMAGGGALVRWGAEARKSKVLGNVALGLTIGGIAGYALDKIAGGAHHVLGTKQRAEKAIAQTEGFGDLSDPKRLKKLADQRKKALVVEKNIARHRRWARVLGSVGAGWLVGHMGGGNGADQEVEGHSSDSSHEGPAAALKGAETHDTSGAADPGASASEGDTAPAPGEHSDAQADAAASAPQHVAVIERGEGFNSLFAELQSSVRDAGTASPLTERLLSMTPTELSDLVNAYDPETGGSMVMQPGDKLYIDGDHLVFERAGDTQILMDVEHGRVETHAFENPQMMSMEIAPAPDQQPANAEAPHADAEDAEEAPVITPAASDHPRMEADSGFIADYVNPDSEPHATSPLESPPSAPIQNVPDNSQPQFIRDYIASEDVGEILTNGHGVEITPDTAAAYELRMEGVDSPYIVVSGGTPDQASLVAEQYANEHPGSRVYFETPVRDPLTGQVHNRLDMWDSIGGSTAERSTNILPDSEAPGSRVPSMDTEDFTRRLTNAP